MLFPLVTIPYISRILDPQGIGKVSFIDSFSYYFVVIAEFGITVYGTREVAKCKNDRAALKNLVSELVILHLITSAITILIYFVCILAVWHKVNDFRMLLFSVSFLLVNAFTCEWYFIGTERFRYITVRLLATRLLGLISIFVVIRAPADYAFYYGITVFSACGNVIWNFLTLYREFGIRWRTVDWRKHVRRTATTYGISLLYGVTLMLDDVFLGLFSTNIALGFYAIAIKIVRVSGTLLSDSLLVFFPRIVSLLTEGNKDYVQVIILRNIQLIIFLSLPICAGLYLLSDDIVKLYLGRAFDPVAGDLKILAIFPFIKTISLFLSRQVLLSHNHEKLFLRSLLIGCLVFVFAVSLLSYYYADRGACWAIILTELVILAMNYYYIRKVQGWIKIFDLREFVSALISVVLFIPVVYFLRQRIGNHLALVACSVALCACVYFLTQLFILRSRFALYLQGMVLQFLKINK